MGLNNYLKVFIRGRSGDLQEEHISFKYGEVREYEYHLGERIFVREEDKSGAVLNVIAGLTYGTRANLKGRPRFYRIIIFDDIPISFCETTESDFDALTQEDG